MDDIYRNYCVLFLEEYGTLGRLFERWLAPLSVRFARSLSELPGKLDSSVAVACLCRSLMGEEAPRVRNEILGANPYCQLVLLQPRDGATTPDEDEYDTWLRRPIFEEELQTTVEHRLKCGIYSALLSEFYVLNAKLIWLERPDTPDELAVAERIDEVYDRHRRGQRTLKRLQGVIDEDDVASIARSIDRHSKAMTTPSAEDARGAGSKYHPPRCPNCGLAWGVDHENELGRGVDSVAAHVWKCRRCDEIVHGLGESHRRVTSR